MEKKKISHEHMHRLVQECAPVPEIEKTRFFTDGSAAVLAWKDQELEYVSFFNYCNVFEEVQLSVTIRRRNADDVLLRSSVTFNRYELQRLGIEIFEK